MVLDRLWVRLREKLRDPVVWTEAIQLFKTALAAVLAWVVVTEIFELPHPFLAPWSALLVVHSTVYRTFSDGAFQVGATVVGVVLAWVVGNSLGMSSLSLGVLMVVGLLVGSLTWFRNEPTMIAAAGLFVLTTGYATRDDVLLLRVADTAVGIAVGLAVNFLVWPPLRDYSAAQAIDRLNAAVGVLLCDIAREIRNDCSTDEVRAWVERTRDLDEDIDDAWGRLRLAWESGRFNPRPDAAEVRTPGDWPDLLHRMEQAVAEVRSMARTLDFSVGNVHEWYREFRDRWVSLVDSAGQAIQDPSSERISEIRRLLTELTRDMSTDELAGAHWPEYGALMLNLRNIITAMDRVTEIKPLGPRAENRRRLLVRG